MEPLSTPIESAHDPAYWRMPPLPHQQENWDRTRASEVRALFWDPGVGKTCPTLATAAYLHAQGEIDGLLVIAPNGVHRNWITDEVPRHLAEGTRRTTLAWRTDKDGTRDQDRAVREVLRRDEGDLAVLAMSYDGLSRTKAGKELAKDFLTRRRCMMVLDEAHRAKSPDALCTKTALAAGRYAAYRRILTGTPVANSPFDVYAPTRFLMPDFWKERGLASFLAFRHHYAHYEDAWAPGGRKFPKLVAHRRLDELRELLATFSDRLTKEQAGLRLPPKLYARKSFEMTNPQARVYRDVKEECLAILDSGEQVDATLALVQLTRLQQIACGYVGVPDGLDAAGRPRTKLVQVDAARNARLEYALELIEDVTHKMIVWCKYTPDVDSLCARLGDAAVRYDGEVRESDRAANLDKFRSSGKVKAIVAKAASLGMGHTLTEAKSVIYYSSTFSLTDRLQSEDRAHRVGQHNPVDYQDVVATGTVDEQILDALVAKHDVAAMVTGDVMREWLRSAR